MLLQECFRPEPVEAAIFSWIGCIICFSSCCRSFIYSFHSSFCFYSMNFPMITVLFLLMCLCVAFVFSLPRWFQAIGSSDFGFADSFPGISGRHDSYQDSYENLGQRQRRVEREEEQEIGTWSLLPRTNFQGKCRWMGFFFSLFLSLPLRFSLSYFVLLDGVGGCWGLRGGGIH